MIAILQAAIALVLATIIVSRVICVVYQTTRDKHAHALLFLGFGYSYVTLGAGAICGALAIVIDHHELADAAIWLLLAGSCGLIAFDRRARQCWTVTACPIDHHKDRDLC